MVAQSWVAPVLEAALSPDQWHARLGDLPCSETWLAAARPAAADVALAQLNSLASSAEEHGSTLEAILRSGVALGLRERATWLPALYLVFHHIEPRPPWSVSLHELVDRALPRNSWARLVATAGQDVAVASDLPPTLRLHVTLATRLSNGLATDWRSIVNVVEAHIEVPKAIVTRVLNEYLALRPLKPRISESRFSRAPLFTRRLLLRSRSLREKILAREPRDIVDLQERARQEWLTQRVVRRKLPKALAAVARRDFDSASRYAIQLKDLPFIDSQLPRYHTQAASALIPSVQPTGDGDRRASSGDFGKAAPTPWEPMPAEVAALLRACGLRDKRSDETIFLLTRTPQILALIAARPGGHLRLPQLDRERLKASWSQSEKQQLYDAGRADLLTPADRQALRELEEERLREEFRRILHRVGAPDVLDQLRAKWASALSLRKYAAALLLKESPPPLLIAAVWPSRSSADFRGAITVARLEQPRFAESVCEAIDAWQHSDPEWCAELERWICSPTARSRAVIKALMPFIAPRIASLARGLSLHANLLTLEAVTQDLPSDGQKVYWASMAGVVPEMAKRRLEELESLAAKRLRDSKAGVRTAILNSLPRLWHSYRPSIPQVGDTHERDMLEVAAVAFHPRTWRIAESIAKRNPEALGAAVDLLQHHPSRRSTLSLAGKLGLKFLPRLAAVAVRTNASKAGPGARLDDCYRAYKLPKQSGGTRTILVPAPWLKGLQRVVYERLLRGLSAHPAAHGFVPGRSIISNAEPHCGRSLVVSCDVASAFPSVRWSVVLYAMRRDFQEVLTAGEIALLVDLCCHQGALPIGAPTSPALLNRVLLPLDHVLEEEAALRDVRYTRYADDLVFSGDRAGQMLPIARRMLRTVGLTLDPNKTNFFRPGRRQLVTGLVVNAKPSVPRRVRRRLRAAIHEMLRGGRPHWHGKPVSRQTLVGWAAFLKMVNPEEGSRALTALRSIP